VPALTVIGYHGTTKDGAASIVASGFRLSTAREDWLGTGAYFFQDAPAHALEWAKQRFGYDVAVVRAEILLDDCLDLLDLGWDSRLRTEYRRLEQEYIALGKKAPRQQNGANVVDREIVDRLVSLLARRRRNIRNVRGAFVEGEPIFPSSALYDRAHVQIAVRDTTLILTREPWTTL